MPRPATRALRFSSPAGNRCRATSNAGACTGSERCGGAVDDEPTLDEHHPAGTHFWSPDAPIAPAFHPANRCDVWQCSACGRAFLRYTEYGGYYQDERVRRLDPALIDTTGCD